mmetsp:Transcript_44298/g.87976  ORF Transcript_44298/g.87976 Transcript_44298/m.87976 type:complete len:85 (+) Transcript_44298:62-316(+)
MLGDLLGSWMRAMFEQCGAKSRACLRDDTSVPKCRISTKKSSVDFILVTLFIPGNGSLLSSIRLFLPLTTSMVNLNRKKYLGGR